MGEEVGRNLGMPIDLFIEEAYPKLNEGLEWIPIGHPVPNGPELVGEYHQMIASRTKLIDKLSELVLAHLH